MARVTVEDCVEQIPNRFELVLTAAKRARKLSNGSVQSALDWENDKSTVLALREIAAGYTFEEDDDEPEVKAETAKSILSGEIHNRNILGSETEL